VTRTSSPSTAPRFPISQVACSYALIFISALVNVAAEVLLKRGSGSVAAKASVGLLGFAALGSIWTWLGVGSKIIQLLIWLWVLRTIPVGIAFALMTAPAYVLVPLGAYFVLHEPMSMARWLGIALVLGGSMLIVRPLAAAEEKL
jgi:undecaprenyl phosphate-alpha-L-ara4N flippase subunit ArnE